MTFELHYVSNTETKQTWFDFSLNRLVGGVEGMNIVELFENIINLDRGDILLHPSYRTIDYYYHNDPFITIYTIYTETLDEFAPEIVLENIKSMLPEHFT